MLLAQNAETRKLISGHLRQGQGMRLRLNSTGAQSASIPGEIIINSLKDNFIKPYSKWYL
jgi:hypothetical protein